MNMFFVDKLKIQQEKHPRRVISLSGETSRHVDKKSLHLYLYCVSVWSLDFKTKQENQQKYSGQDLSSLYFFLLL